MSFFSWFSVPYLDMIYFSLYVCVGGGIDILFGVFWAFWILKFGVCHKCWKTCGQYFFKYFFLHGLFHSTFTSEIQNVLTLVCLILCHSSWMLCSLYFHSFLQLCSTYIYFKLLIFKFTNSSAHFSFLRVYQKLLFVSVIMAFIFNIYICSLFIISMSYLILPIFPIIFNKLITDILICFF